MCKSSDNEIDKAGLNKKEGDEFRKKARVLRLFFFTVITLAMTFSLIQKETRASKLFNFL